MVDAALYEQVQEAAGSIRSRTSAVPRAALILETGSEGLAGSIEVRTTLPIDEIPHMTSPRSKDPGGSLLLGAFAGIEVFALTRRRRPEEGCDAAQAAFPVRLAKALGAQILLITDRAEGLHPKHRPGALMLIEDHVNLQGDNPLIGPNDERLGPRFPDMSAAYSPRLKELARSTAHAERITLHQGVYAAVAGPGPLEPDDHQFLRRIGADAAGRGVVAEVIAGAHQGMEVMAVVAITEVRQGDAADRAEEESGIDAEALAARALTRLIAGVVRSL